MRKKNKRGSEWVQLNRMGWIGLFNHGLSVLLSVDNKKDQGVKEKKSTVERTYKTNKQANKHLSNQPTMSTYSTKQTYYYSSTSNPHPQTLLANQGCGRLCL